MRVAGTVGRQQQSDQPVAGPARRRDARIEVPVDRAALGVQRVVAPAQLLAAHDAPRLAGRMIFQPPLERERSGRRVLHAAARMVVAVVLDWQLHEAVGGVAAHGPELAREPNGGGGREREQDEAECPSAAAHVDRLDTAAVRLERHRRLDGQMVGRVLGVKALALDHVALWVADRDPLSDFVCGHLGMHVIERTDDFTLVGADARRGKLTLFEAEGPREPGPLVRVVLRVRALDTAVADLPADLEIERSGDGLATFDAPEGLGLGLMEVPDTDLDYDIDHVVLAVPDPDRTAERLGALGFSARGAKLSVGDKALLLERGDPGEVERPMLNHLALLVDSGQAQLEEAERRGLDVAEVRDAANTFAVFIWGPDRIKLEYVEHKPGFALV